MCVCVCACMRVWCVCVCMCECADHATAHAHKEFATSTIKQNTYRYTGVHTDGAIADHDTANAANRVLVSARSLDNVSHFFRLRNKNFSRVCSPVHLLIVVYRVLFFY